VLVGLVDDLHAAFSATSSPTTKPVRGETGPEPNKFSHGVPGPQSLPGTELGARRSQTRQPRLLAASDGPCARQLGVRPSLFDEIEDPKIERAPRRRVAADEPLASTGA
jgi:hypothetical protein